MPRLNKNQVIEYLSKKGYNRTEAMLRTEMAAVDPDGRPLPTRAGDEGSRKFAKGMSELPFEKTSQSS